MSLTEKRVPFTSAVEYFCWDQRKSAPAQEISTEGVFLRTVDILAEGSLITLRLRLPGSTRAFTVLGKVVHVVLGSATLRRGMGIQFVDIAPRDRAAIEAYAATCPQLLAA